MSIWIGAGMDGWVAVIRMAEDRVRDYAPEGRWVGVEIRADDGRVIAGIRGWSAAELRYLSKDLLDAAEWLERSLGEGEHEATGTADQAEGGQEDR